MADVGTTFYCEQLLVTTPTEVRYSFGVGTFVTTIFHHRGGQESRYPPWDVALWEPSGGLWQHLPRTCSPQLSLLSLCPGPTAA